MDPGLELLINLIILAGMLVTLCGLIVPVFPGLIVIWLLALLYGIVAGFGTLGAVLFVIITVLAILGEISDNLLMRPFHHMTSRRRLARRVPGGSLSPSLSSRG